MTPIELLKHQMKGSCECALITSAVNRRYFTGMKSTAGTVVVFPDAAYLIIDFRYIERARKTVKDCEVVLQKSGGGLYQQINELCAERGVSEIAVEADTMTLAEADELSKKLDYKLDRSRALSELIGEIRVIKTPEQIEKVIEAQRIAERGFEHMLDFIREGVTEKEIQLELDYFMLRNGAEGLSFDTIALSGANTAMPHGIPTDKPVKRGEFVLMDFGALADGWHSDMTRTVALGEPSEKMRDVYDIVLKAQAAGINAARAGIKGCELDKVARDYIAAHGYGEYFGHSLGHGVGMEIHEAPTASPTCENVLEDGMIVTVEPGIYIEGEFGVRIEDFVVIRENGCENMTRAEKSLIIL